MRRNRSRRPNRTHHTRRVIHTSRYSPGTIVAMCFASAALMSLAEAVNRPKELPPRKES